MNSYIDQSVELMADVPRERLEKIEKGFPGHYLYDPDHYQRELKVFWYKMWVVVGREEEVPNARDYLVKRIGEQDVVVTRDLNGTLRAFHNTCRHRGSVLCTEESGRFEGGSIVCPYHAWTYSLDGKLIATPHQLESADFDMGDYSLYNVAVGTWGGFIFVNLAGDQAPPLASALGTIPERYTNYHLEDLRLGKRIVIDVKANWKLLHENFHECFHCPSVHPELCAIQVSGFTGGQYGLQEDEFGNPYQEVSSAFLSGAVTMTLDGTSDLPPFPGLSDEELNIVYSAATVRPSLLLLFHREYINVQMVYPTGPDSVRMEYDWLFEPASMEREDFDLDRYVEMWDITNRQDARSTEWQQSGVRSHHFQHSNFVPQESGPLNFNRWVLRSLGELGEEVDLVASSQYHPPERSTRPHTRT